jgi:hypothetical protein
MLIYLELYLLEKLERAQILLNSPKLYEGFMGYSELQSTLLQCIFRHKLIHLAEPLLSVIEYETRRIAWQYNHYNVVGHLIFVRAANTNSSIQIAPNWSLLPAL